MRYWWLGALLACGTDQQLYSVPCDQQLTQCVKTDAECTAENELCVQRVEAACSASQAACFAQAGDAVGARQIEALGALVEARLQAVAAGTTPQLARLALLPSIPAAMPYEQSSGSYEVIDGAPLLVSSSDPEWQAYYAAYYGDATAVYRSMDWYTESPDWESAARINVDILQFETPEAALAQMPISAEALMGQSEASEQVAVTLGDAATGVALPEGYYVYFVTGNLMFRVAVTDLPEGMTANRALVEEMAAQQLACHEAGDCTTRFEVTDDLIQ